MIMKYGNVMFLPLLCALFIGIGWASAGTLDPPEGPVQPTMHTLDEIFNLLASQSGNVPEYQSWVKDGGWSSTATETIDIGPGVIHSLIWSNAFVAFYRFEIYDGATLIGIFEHNSQYGRQNAVFPLDIRYDTSLEIKSASTSIYDPNVSVVVTYLSD